MLTHNEVLYGIKNPRLLEVLSTGNILFNGVEYSRREIDDILLALHNVNPLFCAGMRQGIEDAQRRCDARQKREAKARISSTTPKQKPRRSRRLPEQPYSRGWVPAGALRCTL